MDKAAHDRSYEIGDVEPPKEIEVNINGIRGTLAIPHAVNNKDYLHQGYAPATERVALIVHGQGGRRNYCYQKLVAHRLAADLGMYSLRIDFRGCGYLDDQPNPKEGRILERDVEDIQTCAEYLIDGTKNAVGINFLLLAVIGHSRGSVAMFLWALEQEKLMQSSELKRAIIVPNLVNCALRFRSYTIKDRYTFLDDDFEYVEQTAFRHGKLQPVKIPKDELVSLSKPDMTQVRHLSPKWSVLSVYGLEDHIIPRNDCAYYANALNRGPYTHHLELIDGADHNFYGQHPIENSSDHKEYNPCNYPVNNKKLVNYNYLVSAIITEYLRYDQELIRFAARTKYIKSIPRFKDVEGIANFRDVGGWRIAKPTFLLDLNPKTSYYVRPGFVFRCANTIGLTNSGVTALKDLKIATVYDLRSDQECDRDGVSPLLKPVGIEICHNPVFRDQDYSPQLIALRLSNLIKSWHTYVHVYDHILENGTDLFRLMFEHVRDFPNRPFMFHCTAGKDRTGMFAMLVLRLTGLDRHTIAKEYELTTIGLLPDHDKIKENYVAQIRKVVEKDAAVAALLLMGRKNWSIEEDGFNNLISSRYEAMLDTVDLLDTKYGGILKYMKEYLKFSDDDIKKIYVNLVSTDSNEGEHSHLGKVSKF